MKVLSNNLLQNTTRGKKILNFLANYKVIGMSEIPIVRSAMGLVLIANLKLRRQQLWLFLQVFFMYTYGQM